MFGYYADIVRPAAFDCFPPDFRDRLVPLEGCPRCLRSIRVDMAVAKLFAGRLKDVRLLAFLLGTKRLDEQKVRKLLWKTPMEKWIVRTHQVLDQAVAEAKQRQPSSPAQMLSSHITPDQTSSPVQQALGIEGLLHGAHELEAAFHRVDGAKALLAKPTPCSPVTVPPSFSVSSTISSSAASTRCIPRGRVRSSKTWDADCHRRGGRRSR